nr:phytolongin Phyl2.2-like [Ipomoea batatas]
MRFGECLKCKEENGRIFGKKRKGGDSEADRQGLEAGAYIFDKSGGMLSSPNGRLKAIKSRKSLTILISDLSFVHYACVAKDNIVLAKFNSEDAHLGALAMRCLEKTPEFHSMFTHTVRQRPVRTSVPYQP